MPRGNKSNSDAENEAKRIAHNAAIRAQAARERAERERIRAEFEASEEARKLDERNRKR
jgi:hypothetical protein